LSKGYRNMGIFGSAKRVAISAGLYKPARAIHRNVFPSERRRFRDHKALYSRFVNPGDLAFDVGANIGDRVAMLLSLGATVVAFEPQPICARELWARGNGRLTVVQKAVGKTEGNATLYFAKGGDAFASMKNIWASRVGSTSAMIVPVTTLDKAIDEFGTPAYCKIDVEGLEADVLKGLSKAIPTISIEYHCHPEGIASVEECLTMMARLGAYKVNLIGEDNATFLLPKWLSIPDFLRAFPGCVVGHGWGDLFLATTVQ
jgi:FkbM family methyltransferase